MTARAGQLASSCGPPTYPCSRTDTAIVQTPSPLPNMGNLTGANTQITDPDFSNPIVRLTDAAQFNDATMQVSSGSGDLNRWNTDSTFLVVRTAGNGQDKVYGFDPSNLIGAIAYSSNGGISYSGNIEWSRVARTLAYEFPSSTSIISSINLSNCTTLGCGSATPPTPQTVYDFKSSANCLGSSFGVTFADDGGVAANDAAFSIVFSNSGGQDASGTHYVTVYKPGIGCVLLDTKTGAITADQGYNGSTGLTCTGSGCTGQVANWTTTFGSNGITIHNNKISHDGNWVVIVPTGGCGTTACNNPVFWNVATTTVNLPTNKLGGHFTEGYTTWVNTPQTLQGVGRQFATPSLTTIFDNAVPASGDENHTGWNNVDANDSYPVFVSGDSTTITNYTSAYTNEILAVQPALNANKIWRFCHNFNSHKSTAFSVEFVIGSVSQDGRFYMFTSDWMGTLGSTSGATTCTLGTDCRGDVFVVKLQ
jgi:hypothetical protein